MILSVDSSAVTASVALTDGKRLLKVNLSMQVLLTVKRFYL